MNANDTDPYAVEVEHVTRRFRGIVAIDDVSLSIPTGSTFGLVGINGAGKTTLIRHLIGSLKAEEGRVRVLGADPVRDHQQVLQRVGYLTEEDTLPSWMRVGELFDFLRAIYRGWRDDDAKRLCDSFAIRRQSRLKDLSKGQRARVGLLAAIAHRPELLILDEPGSGLDPLARSDILEAIIRTVNEDGRTVLFSSHLLDEVDRVCDHVALIHDGKIIESLEIDHLQRAYQEIVLRCDDVSRPSPQIEGAFGWKRVEREWSAVVTTEAATRSSPPGCVMVDRRQVNLQRWFEARVEQEEQQPAMQRDSEATAHA